MSSKFSYVIQGLERFSLDLPRAVKKHLIRGICENRGVYFFHQNLTNVSKIIAYCFDQNSGTRGEHPAIQLFLGNCLIVTRVSLIYPVDEFFFLFLV